MKKLGSISIFTFAIILLTATCHIKVRSPKELSQKFVNHTIKIGLANFGNIPYGHTIVGKLYYDVNNATAQEACDELDIDIPSTPKVDESPILMVNRGGCTFVDKVRNAQDALAHVALIVDNIQSENVEKVIMADDGRGMEISIPGILISFEDGLVLKEFYKKNKDNKSVLDKIIFEIEFEMEKANNTVEYDLWYTPDLENVYTMLSEMYYYHVQLKKYAKLNIHFVAYTHYSYTAGQRNEVENCLGNGKYCARPGRFGITDGRVVIKEMIKQKCVHQYSYSQGQENLYWLYMINFYNECLSGEEKKFNTECSIYASKLTGIPNDVINKCIAESYEATEAERKVKGFEAHSKNLILDKELEDRQTLYISRVPSLYINGRVFLGSWRADYIFEGLCAGLKKKPEICYSEGGFEKERKTSFFYMCLIVIIVIVVNVIIFCFCMKFIRQRIQERLDSTDINKKISTVVNSYLQMRETQ